jgi:hypothetical protein
VRKELAPAPEFDRQDRSTCVVRPSFQRPRWAEQELHIPTHRQTGGPPFVMRRNRIRLPREDPILLHSSEKLAKVASVSPDGLGRVILSLQRSGKGKTPSFRSLIRTSAELARDAARTELSAEKEVRAGAEQDRARAEERANRAEAELAGAQEALAGAEQRLREAEATRAEFWSRSRFARIRAVWRGRG